MVAHRLSGDGLQNCRAMLESRSLRLSCCGGKVDSGGFPNAAKPPALVCAIVQVSVGSGLFQDGGFWLYCLLRAS